MRGFAGAALALGALAFLSGCGNPGGHHAVVRHSPRPVPCLMTTPNATIPPGEAPDRHYYGYGGLWTIVARNGVIVGVPRRLLSRPGVVDSAIGDGPSGDLHSDGSISVKLPWWGPRTKLPLQIAARRIGSPAARVAGIASPAFSPTRAAHVDGRRSRATGFWTSGVVFPTTGCWRVTGRAGHARLSFVVRVMRASV
jgi:hypothetical protein